MLSIFDFMLAGIRAKYNGETYILLGNSNLRSNDDDITYYEAVLEKSDFPAQIVLIPVDRKELFKEKP